MNARTKLNTAYFYGSILLASMLGAATESGVVFFLALTVLVGSSIYNHEIRLKPPRR